MKLQKTNAMRILDREKIAYTPHSYQTDDGAVDGVAVAKKTGQDPKRVLKTIVCKGAAGGIYVFCIPVEEELLLKSAAAAAKEKNIALLPLQELTAKTGYQRGGCSPVGMKKDYPTFIWKEAMEQPFILVSGGKVGLQIELSPEDLLKVTNGVVFAP